MLGDFINTQSNSESNLIKSLIINIINIKDYLLFNIIHVEMGVEVTVMSPALLETKR